MADLHRSVFQYQERGQRDDAPRNRLRELANERRRFGYLMARIKDELIWPGCRDFADVFVRRQAAEGLEAARVIAGINEIAEMTAELIVIVVVIPFHGRVLNCAVPLPGRVFPKVRGRRGRPSLAVAISQAITGSGAGKIASNAEWVAARHTNNLPGTVAYDVEKQRSSLPHLSSELWS